jgi:hypothetical protein
MSSGEKKLEEALVLLESTRKILNDWEDHFTFEILDDWEDDCGYLPARSGSVDTLLHKIEVLLGVEYQPPDPAIVYAERVASSVDWLREKMREEEAHKKKIRLQNQEE